MEIFEDLPKLIVIESADGKHKPDTDSSAVPNAAVRDCLADAQLVPLSINLNSTSVDLLNTVEL